MIREKKMSSGPLLEADFYPVWNDGRKLPTRAPKTKPSTATQTEYNKVCATKKLIRLVNYNFHKVDYFAHLTYRSSEAPQSEAEARKDINNYLRRVKRRREKELAKARAHLAEAKKQLQQLVVSEVLAEAVMICKRQVKLLRKALKYIYVIERTEYKTGRYAGCANWHFHLFLSGGLSTEVLRNMWGSTKKSTFDHFRPDMFGPEAAATYISKDPQGRKRFVYSKTIKQPPPPKTKDGAVTKRQVEKWCKERCDDREFWERRYKGYRFIRCYPRYNEYNGHWYLSVVMYKTDGEDPPDWRLDAWCTEIGAA